MFILAGSRPKIIDKFFTDGEYTNEFLDEYALTRT
jgi:hypothetical protein